MQTGETGGLPFLCDALDDQVSVGAKLVSEGAVGADSDAARTGLFEHRRNRGRRIMAEDLILQRRFWPIALQRLRPELLLGEAALERDGVVGYLDLFLGFG